MIAYCWFYIDLSIYFLLYNLTMECFLMLFMQEDGDIAEKYTPRVFSAMIATFYFDPSLTIFIYICIVFCYFSLFRLWMHRHNNVSEWSLWDNSRRTANQCLLRNEVWLSVDGNSFFLKIIWGYTEKNFMYSYIISEIHCIYIYLWPLYASVKIKVLLNKSITILIS